MEHTRDVEETTLHQLFQEPSDGKGSLYREPTLRGTGHALRRWIVFTHQFSWKEKKAKTILKRENHHHQGTPNGLKSVTLTVKSVPETSEVNTHAQKQMDNEDHPSQCPIDKTSFFHYLLNIFSILILKFLLDHSIFCRFLVLLSANGFCFLLWAHQQWELLFWGTLPGVLSWKVISMEGLWGFPPSPSPVLISVFILVSSAWGFCVL